MSLPPSWFTHIHDTLTHIVPHRESIYQLLSQTNAGNTKNDCTSYSIRPSTRYPHVNLSAIQVHQVGLPPPPPEQSANRFVVIEVTQIAAWLQFHYKCSAKGLSQCIDQSSVFTSGEGHPSTVSMRVCHFLGTAPVRRQRHPSEQGEHRRSPTTRSALGCLFYLFPLLLSKVGVSI